MILTKADQKAYAAYAKSQRHKGFQSVEVTFEDRTPTATDRRQSKPSD